MAEFVMKKAFIVLLSLFAGTGLFAQAPGSFPGSGDLIARELGITDSASMLDYVISYLAKSIVEEEIVRIPLEEWVKGLQKWYSNSKMFPGIKTAGQRRDAVFNAIMETEASKTSVINGLAGLAPGAFSIPAEAVKQVMEWSTKADVAYAVAYAYGQKPNVEDFKADLYQIFAGPDLVKEAFADIWDPTKKELKENLAKAGTVAARAIFKNKKVQDKLRKTLGEKMLKKISSVGAAFGAAKAAKEVADKVLTPIGAIRDAFYGYMEITQMAKDARRYYYKLPNPNGIYVNLQLGAALNIKGGNVTVMPYHGFNVYDKVYVYDIPRWVSLGTGKYVRNDDDITVTFGKVSWKESNWNAARPVSRWDNIDYYDVESTFSNMAWEIELTGDETFQLKNGKRTASGYKGDGYPIPGNNWYRISGPFVDSVPKDPAANSSVKVTFDTNGGGKISPTDKEVTIGSAYGKMPTVSRAGHSFSGWYTAPTGGKIIRASTNVAIKTDHTLYARWSANGITVTFNSNGGSAPNPKDKGVSPGSAYGELPTVTKAGYNFDGWYTELKGGTKVDAKTTMTNSSNHMLWAHWVAGEGVKVKFNTDGGTPSPSDKGVNPGSAYGELPAVTKAGYSFDGWYTEKTGGKKVDAKTTVTNSSDHTLYARYIVSGIKVTFDSNGGEKPSFADKGVSPGSVYGELPTVSRKDCIFEGWYTEKTGGTKVEAKTTNAKSSDHTLYARWSPVPQSTQDSFFATKAGMVLTYTNNDAKGNTTGYTVLTIKDVKGSGKNMTVTYAGTGLDSNRKPVKGAEMTYQVVIKDGVAVMDINQLIPAEIKDKGIKMDAKGTPVEYPSDLKIGQSLKPSEITMTMDIGGRKVDTVIRSVGKCLAIEDVKVPAGTFKCHKITQTATTTVMGTTNVSTSIEWLAPGIGQVKNEHYDDKNKLISSSVLVELKGK